MLRIDTPVAALAALLALSGASLAQNPAPTTELLSVSSSGALSNGPNWNVASAGNGRFTLFESTGSNLLPADTYPGSDVFVHDRATGTLELVSTDSFGLPGNGDSFIGDISRDGRLVVFSSGASNFASDDTNGEFDIFLKDRETGITTLLSRSALGVPGNGASIFPTLDDTGTSATFTSEATNLSGFPGAGLRQVYIVHTVSGHVTLASRTTLFTGGNAQSDDAHISGNGRYVAFSSEATDLGAVDTNGVRDIYVYDHVTKLVERVSTTSSGIQPDQDCHTPKLGADGRKVLFSTVSGALVPGDTNGVRDAFLKHLDTGFLERVSLDGNGLQADQSTTGLQLAPDAGAVLLASDATNLVAGDSNQSSDVFLKELTTGKVSRMSVSSTGGELDLGAPWGQMSADRKVVAFLSSSNHVTGLPGNSHPQVYIRNLVPADASLFGSGHPGKLGIPSIALDAEAVLASQPNLLVSSSKGGSHLGIVLGGLTQIATPKFGGTLLTTSYIDRRYVALSAGINVIAIDIPDDPALLGQNWYYQVLQRDQFASGGVSFTPGLQLTLGH